MLNGESMDVKVSVIVPVFNAERYIRRCLESIAHQTFHYFEAIIVNDGSTDGSQQIIDKFVRMYPSLFRCIHIENDGVANARNVGMQCACGEYIAFVDSDDYVDPHMLEVLYGKAAEENSQIVIGGYVRESKYRRSKILPNRNQLFPTSVSEDKAVLCAITPYIWNKLFQKSMVMNHGIVFQKLRIFEDMVFTYQCILEAKRISAVDVPLYHYIVGSHSSVSFSYSEKMFDIFPALDALKAFYQVNSDYNETEAELTFVALKHIFLRLETPVKDSLKQSQFDFLSQSFSFLDSAFPKWRENERFFVAKGKLRERYTELSYWIREINRGYYFRMMTKIANRLRNRFRVCL